MTSGSNKKNRRETTPSVLRQALLRKLDQRIVAGGSIEFPCVPGLLDTYLARVLAAFGAFGKTFSAEESAHLRHALETVLAEGHRRSSQARAVVEYRTQAPPAPGIAYHVRLAVESMNAIYAGWVATRPAPLFGEHPDAKVLAVAGTLGEAGDIRILDVGAGTGRNAIALARLGYDVTALEPVPALAAELRKGAAAARVHIGVLEKSVLLPELSLPEEHFHLVVLSEVVPHLRDRAELRAALAKVEAALTHGGRLLLNAFVPTDGYKPDEVTRQVAEVAWCTLFTRGELASVTDELSLERISDESAFDYEKEHLPAEAWPPTPWFEDWAHGRNVFALPAGKVPVELRWLDYRRR